MPKTAGYLLDTNVLIQLIRWNQLGKRIDATYDLQAGLSRNMICAVTVGEIRSLGLKLGWGEKKLDTMQSLLDELVWVDISRPEVLQAYAEIDHYSG